MPVLFMITILLFAFSGEAPCDEHPRCLKLGASATIEHAVAGSGVEEAEVLARLVYAESISTGYPDDVLVYEAIAWGVMNRVRLAEASLSKRKLYGSGIRGVIFMKGQFNPAVSKRSQFSKEFLCPSDPVRWRMAREAAGKALQGEGNPFLSTPWEKEHGLSLVTGFYYPDSIQAKSPLAPWEKSKGLRFIGDAHINGARLPGDKVRFYRLTSPPRDLKPVPKAQ